MSARIPDVRRALMYTALLGASEACLELLRSYTADIEAAVQTLAYLLVDNSWLLTQLRLH